MKDLRFLLIGILFGIILSKSEVISWYRIFEMFKFQAFHMYGIIGSAIITSMLFMFLFKQQYIKDYLGNPIKPKIKKKNYKKSLLGGIIFGLGWALAGACPAPIFVLIGNGVYSMLIVLFGAMFGVLIFGLLQKKHPR